MDIKSEQIISGLNYLGNLKLSDVLSLVGVLTAICSALFSFRSLQTSRKALALSARTAKLADPNATTYLIDAFRYRGNTLDTIVYVFCISVENKSTMQNSIVNVEFRIPYLKDAIETIAVFKMHTAVEDFGPFKIRNQMILPAIVPARGGLINNCCFLIPAEFFNGAEVKVYEVQIVYSDGNPSSLKANIIMDAVDVEALENKRRTGIPI